MDSTAILKDLEDQFLADGVLIDRQTTLVTPILDAQQFFERVGALITKCNGPGDVIYIVGWHFKDDWRIPGLPVSTGTFLQQKASSGVDVRMLLWASRWLKGTEAADSIPELLFNFGAEKAAKSYVEVVNRNIGLAQRFRELGAPDFPLKGRVLLDWSGTRSHHAKYTVVKAGNEIHALIGVDYLADYLDVPQHRGGMQWHEVGVELEGGAVMNVWQDFLTRWKECTTLPLAHFRTDGPPKLYNTATHFPETPIPIPEHVPTPSYSVQILRSQGPTKHFKYFVAPGQSVPWLHYPRGGVQEVWACFKKAIAAAKRYIYVEDQALNDTLNKHVFLFPHVAQALNRDVKVIFVTSTVPDVIFGSTPDPTSLSPDIVRMLDAVEESKRHNFALFRVDRLTVHSKVVLIDDHFLSLGSANFFDASMIGVDSELTVAAVDTGPLVANLRVELWKDHLRIAPDDPTLPLIETELRDLTKSLAIWRKAWGTGVVGFDRGPVLKLVGPPDPPDPE